MATSNSGRWYFPFLDEYHEGQNDNLDIDAVKDDSVKYFRLLVRTHLDYVERAIEQRHGIWMKELEKRIETKARDVFVNTINSLHELDDLKVRFQNNSAFKCGRALLPRSNHGWYHLYVQLCKRSISADDGTRTISAATHY